MYVENNVMCLDCMSYIGQFDLGRADDKGSLHNGT